MSSTYQDTMLFPLRGRKLGRAVAVRGLPGAKLDICRVVKGFLCAESNVGVSRAPRLCDSPGRWRGVQWVQIGSRPGILKKKPAAGRLCFDADSRQWCVFSLLLQSCGRYHWRLPPNEYMWRHLAWTSCDAAMLQCPTGSV